MFCVTSFYMSRDRLAGKTEREVESKPSQLPNLDQLNLELLNSLKTSPRNTYFKDTL